MKKTNKRGRNTEQIKYLLKDQIIPKEEAFKINKKKNHVTKLQDSFFLIKPLETFDMKKYQQKIEIPFIESKQNQMYLYDGNYTKINIQQFIPQTMPLDQRRQILYNSNNPKYKMIIEYKKLIQEIRDFVTNYQKKKKYYNLGLIYNRLNQQEQKVFNKLFHYYQKDKNITQQLIRLINEKKPLHQLIEKDENLKNYLLMSGVSHKMIQKPQVEIIKKQPKKRKSRIQTLKKDIIPIVNLQFLKQTQSQSECSFQNKLIQLNDLKNKQRLKIEPRKFQIQGPIIDQIPYINQVMDKKRQKKPPLILPLQQQLQIKQKQLKQNRLFFGQSKKIQKKQKKKFQDKEEQVLKVQKEKDLQQYNRALEQIQLRYNKLYCYQNFIRMLEEKKVTAL